MGATWMRAILASSPALLRASRSGLTCRRVQFSSLRSASVVATQSASDGPATSKVVPKSSDASAIPDASPPFTSLRDKISPQLLKAITVAPFRLTRMSTVQAQVLPLLPGLATPYDKENPPKERKDLLVKAKTGTGKTLGFLVPAVESRLNEIAKHSKQMVRDNGMVASRDLEAKARRVFSRTHAGCLIISPTRELATQIANEALRQRT